MIIRLLSCCMSDIEKVILVKKGGNTTNENIKCLINNDEDGKSAIVVLLIKEAFIEGGVNLSVTDELDNILFSLGLEKMKTDKEYISYRFSLNRKLLKHGTLHIFLKDGMHILRL